MGGGVGEAERLLLPASQSLCHMQRCRESELSVPSSPRLQHRDDEARVQVDHGLESDSHVKDKQIGINEEFMGGPLRLSSGGEVRVGDGLLRCLCYCGHCDETVTK